VLILARKSNESIIIGGDIRITVLEIHGENVKLGIDAPATVKILREELYKAVQEQNVEAGVSARVKGNILDGLEKLFEGAE